MSSDKIIPINERLSKSDFEIVLEVNRKAIEIEADVAEQNEEVISLLTENNSKQIRTDEKIDALEEKMDKLIKQSDEMVKDIFKIQVLFVTGLISIVILIIQIFLHK